MDQLLFAPVFLPAFFSVVLIVDGTPEKIGGKLQSEMLSTLLTNYSVWVPAMFINFKFIPPHLNVLFSNSVGFFWNIYLSSASYRSIPASAPASASASASAPKSVPASTTGVKQNSNESEHSK
jgi:Mpv17 / PMP22 family